jgi:hypothetical protein
LLIVDSISSFYLVSGNIDGAYAEDESSGEGAKTDLTGLIGPLDNPGAITLSNPVGDKGAIFHLD